MIITRSSLKSDWFLAIQTLSTTIASPTDVSVYWHNCGKYAPRMRTPERLVVLRLLDLFVLSAQQGRDHDQRTHQRSIAHILGPSFVYTLASTPIVT